MERNMVDVYYDNKHKALVFHTHRDVFVPSYLYHLVEYFEGTKGYKVKRVMFLLDTSRAYRKKELKGKNSWLEIDKTDIERIN